MSTQLISEFEKSYTVAGLAANMRADGRNRTQFRPFRVETGVVSNTNGSARLRLAETDVIVGVKGEIGEPSRDAPHLGRVIVHVECSASASPEFEGKGGDELSGELAHTLQMSMDAEGAVDLEALCIEKGHVCWDLHIDALVMVARGNLVDALSLCIRAALQATRLPEVTVAREENSGGEDDEGAVSLQVSDTTVALQGDFPLTVTVTVVDSAVSVVDLTRVEEAAVRDGGVRVGVVVGPEGDVRAVLQSGRQGCTVPALLDATKNGCAAAVELVKRMASVTRHLDGVTHGSFIAES